MMMSIGCIQALRCNLNDCLGGLATQKESLLKGLDVDDKSERAARYHKETVHSFVELAAAAGVSNSN